MFNYKKKNKNLEYFIFFIFVLTPLSIIFSRFLANAIIIGFFLFLIFKSSKNKDWSFLKTEISLYLFLFLFYLLFSFLFIHKIESKIFLKLIWLFAVVIFLLGLSNYAFILKKKKVKTLILFFFFLTVFVVFDTIYQFSNPKFKDIFGFVADTQRTYLVLGNKISLPIRLTGPFGDEQVVGFYLATFGYLSIFLLKSLYKLSDKKYYTFLFINFSTVILSGERSSMLTYFVIFIIQQIFERKKLKQKFFIVIALTAVFLVSVFLNPATRERLSDIPYWLVKKENNKNDLYSNFLKTPWGNHFEISLDLIKLYPFFGIGIRNFEKFCHDLEKKNIDRTLLFNEYENLENIKDKQTNEYYLKKEKILELEKTSGYSKTVKSKCSTHPHNYILELLVETGLFGFLLFLSLIIKIIFIFITKYRHNSHVIMFISLFSGFLFPFKPSGAIFSSWFGFFFWLLLAMFLITINLKKKN
jgi:O-antigen ligase